MWSKKDVDAIFPDDDSAMAGQESKSVDDDIAPDKPHQEQLSSDSSELSEILHPVSSPTWSMSPLVAPPSEEIFESIYFCSPKSNLKGYVCKIFVPAPNDTKGKYNYITISFTALDSVRRIISKALILATKKFMKVFSDDPEEYVLVNTRNSKALPQNAFLLASIKDLSSPASPSSSQTLPDLMLAHCSSSSSSPNRLSGDRSISHSQIFTEEDAAKLKALCSSKKLSIKVKLPEDSGHITLAVMASDTLGELKKKVISQSSKRRPSFSGEEKDKEENFSVMEAETCTLLLDDEIVENLLQLSDDEPSGIKVPLLTLVQIKTAPLSRSSSLADVSSIRSSPRASQLADASSVLSSPRSFQSFEIPIEAMATAEEDFSPEAQPRSLSRDTVDSTELPLDLQSLISRLTVAADTGRLRSESLLQQAQMRTEELRRKFGGVVSGTRTKISDLVGVGVPKPPSLPRLSGPASTAAVQHDRKRLSSDPGSEQLSPRGPPPAAPIKRSTTPVKSIYKNPLRRWSRISKGLEVRFPDQVEDPKEQRGISYIYIVDRHLLTYPRAHDKTVRIGEDDESDDGHPYQDDECIIT